MAEHLFALTHALFKTGKSSLVAPPVHFEMGSGRASDELLQSFALLHKSHAAYPERYKGHT